MRRRRAIQPSPALRSGPSELASPVVLAPRA
ncbi:hypothetical protein N8H20_20905, partial [Mycobacterium tuberculosis]